MTDYATLDRQLTGRCRNRRKVANNTYAERVNDREIGIRLHNTVVVKYTPEGAIVLDSGGWQTVTTKDRMNTYAAPARISSVKGQWRVSWHGHEYPYADHMVLHQDGTVTGIPSPTEQEREQKRIAWRKRQVKEYLAGITPEKIVYAWQHAGGDPWCCAMRATDGTYPMSHDCVAGHVQHRQFHASLAFRAIAAKGYHEPAFIMQMILADAQRGRVDSSLTQALRKFFTKELKL